MVHSSNSEKDQSLKSDNIITPIRIRSKNDLAKRISDKNFPYEDALTLINTVQKDFDNLWRDNLKDSKPEVDK